MTALARLLGEVRFRWSADDPLLEFYSLTCCHCNCVVFIIPDNTRDQLGLPRRKRERGYCANCDAYVCDQPVCRAICTPIMAQIDYALRHPEVPVLQRPGGQLPYDPEVLKEVRVF